MNGLIDAHAEKITSKKLSSQVLLDVNSEWLKNNLSRLEPTGIAYVIRFDNYEQLNQIKPTLKLLLEKGFAIGFRFRRFSQYTVTVLQQIKPSFIVFNYNLVVQDSQLQIENYLYLISLRKIFQDYNTTIIWENFSEKITAIYQFQPKKTFTS
ncbi:hypothetical protein [Mycoplasma sp. ATU-Cv-508]|uniref:hypothetical protein n=1 Tax=Mycoplasma sp. ATU-Cv-508 TaxID=2048001 RepID=UPI000FDDAA77